MSSVSCKKHIKEYCANSTFAGIHYIADDTKHWSERWLWVALVSLSWYASVTLIISAWEAFTTNPISFGVDTNYIDWETKMPSVAICEHNNKYRIFNISDTIWPPAHSSDLEDVLQEISYFRGALYSTIDHCYSKIDPLCPQSNFSYYANLVRSKCLETLSKCSYNGQHFNCCEYFQHIITDLGSCYILNSIQTESPKLYAMVNNKTARRSVIRFEALVPSKIYTLGEDEVPSIFTSQSSILSINIGYKFRRHVSVRNIENDLLVSETTPEQRACKFNDETEEEQLYPHYSLSTCLVACRKRAQMRLCGCNDHFMPGSGMSDDAVEDHCNITGLVCLATNFDHLTTLKPSWATRPGLSCDCLPSCVDIDISVIKNEKISQASLKRKKSIVEIVLARLPTERFRRSVVRSRLDLVVSIGGTTGLFVGASLLSFVELLFYFTIRLISNIIIEKNEESKILKHISDENEIEEVMQRTYITG